MQLQLQRRQTTSGGVLSNPYNCNMLYIEISRSEAERAFELPYFDPRPAVVKLIVQGSNTDK